MSYIANISNVWANWESRSAAAFVADPNNVYGEDLNKWFAVWPFDFDCLTNMLTLIACRQVNPRFLLAIDIESVDLPAPAVGAPGRAITYVSGF